MSDANTIRPPSGTGIGVNVAVTVLGPNILRTQLPVPEQSLDQPVKVDPESGVAVSVNVLPKSKYPKSRPQSRGLTVPAPSPEQLSNNVGRVKTAVTFLSESMAKVQGSVPAQSPDQPRKYDLPSGVAVSVTVAPKV